MLEGKDGAPADGDGFSGADYWSKHVLLFDVLKENWGGEDTVGWQQPGQKMLDLFCVPLHADPESEPYQEASALTWRLLTRSSMQKITHGKGLTHDVQLGALWDVAENEDKDCAKGTFAELLRFGSVNFEQTRERIEYMEAPKPHKTMRKGLLEL